MAINANFPSLSFADANPYLTGLELGRKGMRESLNFPKELLAKELENRKAELLNKIYGVQAQYEEPLTKEKLLKSILENKYYGPDKESQIGLRSAESSHLGAETNKLNELLPMQILAAKIAAQKANQDYQNKLPGSESNPEYIKPIQQAMTDAQNANSMDMYIDQFKNAYGKSTYKGAGVFGSGSTPTTGMLAGLRSTFHDFTPEQEADNAAQNLQRAMIPLLKTNRLTNYELQFLGNLKLNRTLTPGAVGQISDVLEAANARVKEYPKFLLAAQQRGIDPNKAPILFDMYKEAKPIIEPGTNKIKDENLNTYEEFLDNPQQASSNRQSPRNSKQETLEDLDKESPSAKQQTQGKKDLITDQDIEFTAKKYNISKQEVIERLKKAGRM